jgi:hypothetical protein
MTNKTIIETFIDEITEDIHIQANISQTISSDEILMIIIHLSNYISTEFGIDIGEYLAECKTTTIKESVH